MTFFAVFLFFSFAVVGLTTLGARGFARLRELRTALALFWGIGLAWLANLNMWSSWHVPGLRYAWVGVTVTGAALAGTSLILYAVIGWFMSLHRKLDDEARRIEAAELRRVA